MMENHQAKTGKPQFHATNAGYREHWQKVGEIVERAERESLRRQGTTPTDSAIIDSLLQFGFLHGDRNPPTGLIQWQARLAEAYRRHPEFAKEE